jgi:hypothetical protein
MIYHDSDDSPHASNTLLQKYFFTRPARFVAPPDFGSFLVTSRIVTAAGRKNDRSLMVIVKQL